MLRLVRGLLTSILLLLSLLPVGTCAQDPPPPAVATPAPQTQIFSGFVTAFTPATLSVSRKKAGGAGKEMILKSFMLDGQTKVEGKIKLNARVSVQFSVVDAETNHAVRIIVRGN